ncbi:hypothetical protein HZH66_013441 [Vespula vulgaris]|uniref:Uncharacterized protein n=1 Tax=Vespula vulgaris TaxID=7454 RepID=A0A834MSG7_VESVU|nr:hypothetical protein HZH66_013441 [Vespula vulgaris]
MFVTTIDVTLRDYHRFEIPSVPRFFDLRNPRVLKEERWPRGEPFHGDVSRIIANVDTTSDVVFPVDKVAFGRRG